MRWGQKKNTYGNPKWHWFDGAESFCREWRLGPLAVSLGWEWMPEDQRPGLARNNVCMRCKKHYLATRPDLQAMFDRLNDKKDV